MFTILVKTSIRESVTLSWDEATSIPLFSDIIKHTYIIDHLEIDIPFCAQTLRNYLKWNENNDTANGMEWQDLIELFMLADFTGCDHFLRYFVLNIVKYTLIENDTFTIRYLLSKTKDRTYLEVKFDDSLEMFNDEDYLLSYVKLEDLLSLFRSVSLSTQHKLHQTFPRSHRFHKHLLNEIFMCREPMYNDEEETI